MFIAFWVSYFPTMVSGFIYYCANNYRAIYKLIMTFSIRHLTFLEEIYVIIPLVLRKYYSEIVEVNNSLLPSMFKTTFWQENTEWKRLEEAKERKDYLVNIYKKTGLALSLILFFIIIITWHYYESITLYYQGYMIDFDRIGELSKYSLYTHNSFMYTIK